MNQMKSNCICHIEKCKNKVFKNKTLNDYVKNNKVLEEYVKGLCKKHYLEDDKGYCRYCYNSCEGDICDDCLNDKLAGDELK